MKRKCLKNHSSVHSEKDSRKHSRKQTCERARKTCLCEWSGVEAVGGSVDGLSLGTATTHPGADPNLEGQRHLFLGEDSRLLRVM